MKLLCDWASVAYCVQINLDDWVIKKSILVQKILTESFSFSVNLSRKM